MRKLRYFILLSVCFSPICARSQEIISAPEPQPGTLVGTVTDADGDSIPGATVLLVVGTSTNNTPSATTDIHGFFTLAGVRSASPVHILVSARGFASWESQPTTLSPGQYFEMKDIKLNVAAVETSVTAVFAEKLALEQVKAEEKQRVLGIVPNFYVVYDHNAVPLTSALKFRLAMKAATDVATIGGVGFVAGLDQAADHIDFTQGAKGYAQRFGATYADGFTDIMIGGAILPSLLHQDPRYFYQGTGTTKSRVIHALSAPFVCKGDDGKLQFNYSTIGGDLASGALSNLYYPASNRGPSLVFDTALTAAGGRMINALAQEFLLKRFTSGDHKGN